MSANPTNIDKLSVRIKNNWGIVFSAAIIGFIAGMVAYSFIFPPPTYTLCSDDGGKPYGCQIGNGCSKPLTAQETGLSYQACRQKRDQLNAS